MKLYWGPHTCAVGIHLLLEEIGRPYELVRLDVQGGANQEPAFLAVNPKGKVPVIERDDGSVLTEFGAIATWLARTNPDKGLIPADPEGEARVHEMLDYAVGTVHMQGFARCFKPARFEPEDVIHGTLGLGKGATKAQGRAMVEAGFAILSRQLADRPFAGGNALSIADAALFYIEDWASEFDIKLPTNLSGHLERMKTRPAVAHALAQEREGQRG